MGHQLVQPAVRSVGGHVLAERPFIDGNDRTVLIRLEERRRNERFWHEPSAQVDTAGKQKKKNGCVNLTG